MHINIPVDDIFRYKGKDQKGKVRTGSIFAENKKEAARLLGNRKIVVYRLKPVSPLLELFTRERKLKLEELSLFLSNLETISLSGIPILDGLKMLVQSSEKATKKLAESLIDSCEEGLGLSEGFRLSDLNINPVIISLIEAGEKSGRLDEALSNSIDLLEKDLKLKKMTLDAVRYPMVVVLLAMINMMIALFFILPKFSQIYKKKSIELPLITEIFLSAGDFAKGKFVYILTAAFVLSIAFMNALKERSFREKLERYLYKLPIFGSIYQNISIARWATGISMMLKSGISIIDSMKEAARFSGSFKLERISNFVVDEMKRGTAVALAVERGNFLRSNSLQILKVGESSGNLDKSFGIIKMIFERSTQRLLDKIEGYIEPVLIVMVGLSVLILALAVYLPMWDIIKIAK